MKKTISPGATPEAWDAEALFLKSHRYAERMAEQGMDAWERALWSSLSLELLARATLANVSPALLADSGEKNWQSLFHSLGFEPKESKFSPKSISAADLFRRLGAIFPDFTQELESFCVLHTGRRNTELHSGEAAFDKVANSSWQPRYYQACEVLLGLMGLALVDLVGADEAEAAKKLVAAAADDSAKAVRGDVEAHKKVWLAKSDKERATLTDSALVWATRQAGHRVQCPSCNSAALVAGDPITTPHTKLNHHEITETQEFLPGQFECIACGLKILGLSRLNAVGLGDRYKKTLVYDAVEYYAPEIDRFADFDDDNNEPM